MSAASFTIFDTGPSGPWPLAAAGGGPVGASVRHLIDLSHFFRDGVRSWPDALATEARRHIAGCLSAIETALVSEARSSAIGSTLALIDRPTIWPAVQRHPHILSPELMAHMRLRAAVGLLGAQALRGHGDPAAEARQGTAWLIEDNDPALADLAAQLMRAETRWSAQVGTVAGSTMRADLPAEPFTELVWTSAAVLGTELHRTGLAEQNAAMTAMTDAAFAVLARHDEEAGGFALATRLVRTLRDGGRHAELLGQALSERRYLLFSALAGELADVELDAVLDVLVHGSDAQLAALCKALGGTASDYRHLLLDLRIVRGERDDPTLVRLSQSYDDLPSEDAADQLQCLRRPAALRTKLAMIPQLDRE